MQINHMLAAAADSLVKYVRRNDALKLSGLLHPGHGIAPQTKIRNISEHLLPFPSGPVYGTSICNYTIYALIFLLLLSHFL